MNISPKSWHYRIFQRAGGDTTDVVSRGEYWRAVAPGVLLILIGLVSFSLIPVSAYDLIEHIEVAPRLTLLAIAFFAILHFAVGCVCLHLPTGIFSTPIARIKNRFAVDKPVRFID